MIFRRALLTFLSVVLFCGAYPNAVSLKGYGVLIWFFAIPLFEILSEYQSKPKIFFLGFFYGLCVYSLLLYWLLPVHFWAAVFFIMALSVQPALFLWASAYFMKLPKAQLFLPSLWIITEWLRSFLLGGFSWGVAQSQTFSIYPLQMVQIFGPYGLSFIILLVNFLIWLWLKNKRQWGYAVSGCVIILALVGFGQLRLNQPKPVKDALSVCTVQPNISSTQKHDPREINAIAVKTIALSSQCFSKNFHPSIVLWPETSFSDDVITDEYLHKSVSDFIHKHEVPLLMGSALYENEKDYNSVLLFNSSAELQAVYDKQKIVPFMEYYPFKIFKNELYKNSYEFHKREQVGNFSVNQRSFIPVICAEDGYHSFIKNELLRYNPDFMVVLLSDSEFNNPQGMIMHLQNSILQAVSFGLPIIRVSNSGWSGWISAQGIIGSSFNQNLLQEDVSQMRFPLEKRRTFYSKTGNVFIVICLLFVIMGFVLNISNKKK